MSILYYENELYHYGIKGMKWGRRRFQNADGTRTAAGKKRYDSDGIPGIIRRKQRSNATADLNEVRSKLRDVDSELRELRGYEKNPSKLGKTKISTAIRRNQIKSLEKTRSELKGRERDNLEALKELDSIEKYRAEKKAKKAAANAARDKQIMDARKDRQESVDELKKGGRAYAESILSGDKTARKKAVNSVSKSFDKYMNSKDVAEQATSGETKVAAMFLAGLGAMQIAAWAYSRS